MICHNDFSTYKILNDKVNVFTAQLDYGPITFIEIEDIIRCVGHEEDNIMSAVFGYQEIYDHILTEEEMRTILEENNLNSKGI